MLKIFGFVVVLIFEIPKKIEKFIKGEGKLLICYY